MYYHVLRFKMRFRLPSDTRLTEIISCLSLILTGVLSYLTNSHYYPGPVSASEPNAYWSLITLIFGSVHIIALYDKGDLRMLRGVLSWFSGTFWIYMALVTASAGILSLHALTTLILGLGCYYAFTVNTIITLRDELR